MWELSPSASRSVCLWLASMTEPFVGWSLKLGIDYYNKTNEVHQFLKFIFGIELYTFRTGFLSIIRSLVLYTQQQVYVIQVMLTAC